MHRFLLLIAICALSLPSFAQSPVLEAYIQEGLSGNLTLKQQQLDLQKSMEAIRQSKSLFYPAVQFNANYTRAAGGRRIDFPIGDLLNPVYQTLNQITQSNQFPTLENQQIQFLPDNFHETKVNIRYPLYNSDLKYNQQIQTQLYQSKSAQKTAYAQALRYQITEAYLQYLQALEAEKIWRNTKTVLLELRRFNESLVKNDVATKDVVATADYEISKADNEIFKLQSGQRTARAYFNFLINQPLQREVVADTSLLRKALDTTYQSTTLIQQALNNRQEFAALRAGMRAAELDVKRNDANQRLPDFYIGGELGFQGFGYKFNSEQAYMLAQIGVQYDIFDKGLRKSKTQEARIEAEKIRNQLDQAEQQVALQVTQAWNELDAAQHSFQTANTGLKAAEAGYRIIHNKYRASQALLIEYLDAQNRVTAARLQVVLAWTDVLLKEAALKRAIGG